MDYKNIKVNDIVYGIQGNEIKEYPVIFVGKTRFQYYNGENNVSTLYHGYIRSIFLTRQEAEMYLAEQIEQNKVRRIRNFDVKSRYEIQPPRKPHKPTISSSSPTESEILAYSTALSQYNIAFVVYEEEYRIYQNKLSQWVSDFKEYLKMRDLNNVPQKIADIIYSYADMDGHSSGYEEIASYHSKYAEFAEAIMSTMGKQP